jgi:hypothetical protein
MLIYDAEPEEEFDFNNQTDDDNIATVEKYLPDNTIKKWRNFKVKAWINDLIRGARKQTSQKGGGKNAILVDLDPTDKEYKTVAHMFNCSKNKRKIEKIERIHNKILWTEFLIGVKNRSKDTQLKNESMELPLWFGPSNDPQQIYEDPQNINLNQMFLSQDPSYYMDKSYKKSNNERQLLLMRVRPGKIQKHKRFNSLVRNRTGFTCMESLRYSTKGYILFENYRYYPEYLVTFNVNQVPEVEEPSEEEEEEEPAKGIVSDDPTACIRKYINIGSTFKEYANTMIEICKKAVNGNRNDRKAIQSRIFEISEKNFRNPLDLTTDVEVKYTAKIYAISPLYSLFNYYLEKFYKYDNVSDFLNQTVDKCFSTIFYNSIDIFRDHGCGNGANKLLFNELLKDILDKNLFINNGDKLSPRYLINPNYQFDITHLIDQGFTFKNQGFDVPTLTQALYKMVGSYFAFCIVNNLPLIVDASPFVFRFGYTLLYSMLKNYSFLKEYEDTANETVLDTIVALYFLDFPDNASSMVALMRNPSDITGFRFNDNFPILKDDRDLNEDNLIEYLRRTAYYNASHNFITGENYDMYNNLIAFQLGFNINGIHNIFNELNVDIFMLDFLLSPDYYIKISNEIINEFLDATDFKSYKNTDKNCSECKICRELISNMLVNRGKSSIDQFDNTNFNFNIFFLNLLKTINGQPNLTRNKGERFTIILVDEIRGSSDENSLPFGSSCARTLSIHSNDINDRNKFYEKVYKAIYFSGGMVDG